METRCRNHPERLATNFVYSHKHTGTFVKDDSGQKVEIILQGKRSGNVCADCKAAWDEGGFDKYSKYIAGL